MARLADLDLSSTVGMIHRLAGRRNYDLPHTSIPQAGESQIHQIGRQRPGIGCCDKSLDYSQ
jgi:hypothetical protein